jgi:hypothetical protein
MRALAMDDVDVTRPVDETDLDTWRRTRGLTWSEIAGLIGASSPRQARAWGLGIERPSATQQARIAERTGGAVSVFVMHRVRLAWEREHRRPMGRVPRRAERTPRRRRPVRKPSPV